MVEQGIEAILDQSVDHKVAFLVVGDVFGFPFDHSLSLGLSLSL